MTMRESGTFAGFFDHIVHGGAINGNPWAINDSSLKVALYTDGFTPDLTAFAHYGSDDWSTSIMPTVELLGPSLRFSAYPSEFDLHVDGSVETIVIDQNFLDVSALSSFLNVASESLPGHWATDGFNVIFTGTEVDQVLAVDNIVDPGGNIKRLTESSITDGTHPTPTEVEADGYDAGGKPLVSDVTSGVGSVGLTADPSTWDDVTFSANGALLYYEGTNEALAFITFGKTFSAQRGAFSVRWPSPIVQLDFAPSTQQAR